jgi:hypothetical protein
MDWTYITSARLYRLLVCMPATKVKKEFQPIKQSSHVLYVVSEEASMTFAAEKITRGTRVGLSLSKNPRHAVACVVLLFSELDKSFDARKPGYPMRDARSCYIWWFRGYLIASITILTNPSRAAQCKGMAVVHGIESDIRVILSRFFPKILIALTFKSFWDMTQFKLRLNEVASNTESWQSRLSTSAACYLLTVPIDDSSWLGRNISFCLTSTLWKDDDSLPTSSTDHFLNFI